MIIRLSQLAILEVSAADTARDLDVSPKLYSYQYTVAGRTNHLLVQEDTSPLQQCTRNAALAPFWNNVLLGTPNFYPEQGLGIANFHNDSELHELLSQVTLPAIEYKRATVFFSQGLVGDANVRGHWIRVYVKRANDTDVNLISFVDFNSTTNITAKSPKLFESQIFNEGISFEFIDVEFLLSSPIVEIANIRTLLFGNERPLTYFVEYSAFGEEAIDDFTQTGLQFTRLNFAVINQQSFPVTFEQSELFAKISFQPSSYSLLSEMAHQKYDVQSYLDTLKRSEETYKVEHTFTVTSYSDTNVLIEVYTQTISNPTNQFDQIRYRPVIDLAADHAMIDVTIRIENLQSGLIFRRDASIVITSTDIHKFKQRDTVSIPGLGTFPARNTVERTVNQIVASNEIPKIVTLEKRLYIQSQSSDKIQLLDANQLIEISSSANLAGLSKLLLQIDNLIIENEPGNLLKFMIPKTIYSTEAKKYLLLDYQQNVVSTGLLVK